MKANRVFISTFASLLSLTLAAHAAVAVAIPPEQVQFFESKIRPILVNHCLECHSAEKGKTKGSFSMDTREEILKGGETGAAFKPGDAKGSAMIKAVEWADDLQMPPKKKLSDDQIKDLTEWVAMGAPDPRVGGSAGKPSKKDHWAFQPVSRPTAPAVKNADWCVNSVDKFILAKLEEKQMLPAPPASKEALLRRAYFDLIGLPPSPAKILAFVQDESPDAFARIVEELLASPQYGERWGRHWLDTARYADTKGFIPESSMEDYHYPFAYTYRDWVIKAFNEDMPYDQFILQQLAADKIPDNKRENLAALGILTLGKKFQDPEEVMADRIDVIGRGFLGLTVACARCHDHKFDPISIKDYYALRGVFASVREPVDLPVIHGDPNSAEVREFNSKLADLQKQNLEGFYAAHREFSDAFRKHAEAYLEVAYLSRKDAAEAERKRADQLEAMHKLDPNIIEQVKRSIAPNNPVMGPLAKILSGESQESVNQSIDQGRFNKGNVNLMVAQFLKDSLPAAPEKKVTAFAKLFLSVESKVASAYQTMADASQNAMESSEKGLLEIAGFPLKPISAVELPDHEAVRTAWIKTVPFRSRGMFWTRSKYVQISELMMNPKGAPVRAMVMEDLPKPIDSPVFPRGNKPAPDAPKVPRRFLEILSSEQAEPFKDGSGRLELAKAIADKSNPLTARVMVNRIWMHHFGEGLVRTPDDLGNQSGKPTHPELLDFLASWFMEDFGPAKPAWSVKAMHKAIMLSKTYQQTSTSGMRQQDVDPANQLLWRANLRRLDFESFRDSLLTMAGKLDLQMGGAPVNVIDEPFSLRRSVYGYVDRGNMPDLLMQFDVVNPVQPNSQRRSTLVPQQALFLMNSPFVVMVTKQIILRPEIQRAENDRQRILAIYQIVLQRTPSKEEFELANKFLAREAKSQAAEEKEMKAVAAESSRMTAKNTPIPKVVGAAALQKNMTKAIVNEGEVIQRIRLSPWETLVQTLLFANEAAYVN